MFDNNDIMKKPRLEIVKGEGHQFQLVNEQGELISNAFIDNFKIVSNQTLAQIIIKGISTDLLMGDYRNWRKGS
jgi:hypothetical protein